MKMPQWITAIITISFLSLFDWHCNAAEVHKPIALNTNDRSWFEIKNDPRLGEIRPPPKQSTPNMNTEIFVSIASLHDNRCGRSLHSLLSTAANPNRIRFGVVQQNNDDTRDCIDSYCAMTQGKEYTSLPDPNLDCPFVDNIKTIRMHSSEAKGPNLARGLGITMLEHEEFCLQVDAHIYGDQDWDVKMLEEWEACDNEMAILTTYMGSPENIGKNVGGAREVPHLCTAYLTGDFPFNDRASAARYLDRPILNPLWAAGLSFQKCHADIKVPYDINLIQIWTGEEFGRGARLWTSGYDFYTLTKPIIGHDYSPGPDQKKWNHNEAELKKSRNRLQTVLRVKGSNQSIAAHTEIGKYNLGTKRTMEQYIEFCGVDTINRKINRDYCIDYEWVPYQWTDEEIKHISRIGHKHGLLEEVFEHERAAMVKIRSGVVDEMHHFQDSDTSGKVWHIVVGSIILVLVPLSLIALYKVALKRNPKLSGEKII